MMFRRSRNTARKGSYDASSLLLIDDSSSSSNNNNNNNNNNSKGNTSSRHSNNKNTKNDLSTSLPELRKCQSLTTTTPLQMKPIKGILRITSVQDSLHTTYGSGGGAAGAAAAADDEKKKQQDSNLIDTSHRSSQSDDMIIRHRSNHGCCDTVVNNNKQLLDQSKSKSSSSSSSSTVFFQAIEIREYERTIGDNPSCSSGPPVSISWDYYPEVLKLPLDDYETYRSTRRSSYEMILSREIRHTMLRYEWDISRNDIASAIRDTMKIKNQRRQTIQNLNKDKVEELFENASKKILRSLSLFTKSSNTKQEYNLLNQQYDAVQELRRRQLEMELAKEREQQQQQQQYSDVVDSLVVVGMNIDEDEVMEDDDLDDDIEVDDDDDEDAVFREDTDTVNTTKCLVSDNIKNPILITEEDDEGDTELFHNVGSDHTQHNTYTTKSDVVNNSTPITPATTITTTTFHDPPTMIIEQNGVEQNVHQQQYKGENSSEDGSLNHNSHHLVIYTILQPQQEHDPSTTTTTKTTPTMNTVRTTTEI